MSHFLFSTWRSGFRGRGFYAVLLLSVFLVGGAFLAGLSSPRQPATVVLDVGISCLRFSLVLFALVWVQELVGKEIDRRTVVLTFSYPVTKFAYVAGRFGGIAALLFAATLVFGLLLWLMVLASGQGYAADHPPTLGVPYWLTLFGIWVDSLVVTAFALMICALATVSALPLALGATFAILGKMVGPVADYLARGADGLEKVANTYGPVLEVIRFVIPDLSRLDWRDWPMYGTPIPPDAIGLALVMAVGYATLMLFVASRALARREFS